MHISNMPLTSPFCNRDDDWWANHPKIPAPTSRWRFPSQGTDILWVWASQVENDLETHSQNITNDIYVCTSANDLHITVDCSLTHATWHPRQKTHQSQCLRTLRISSHFSCMINSIPQSQQAVYPEHVYAPPVEFVCTSNMNLHMQNKHLVWVNSFSLHNSRIKWKGQLCAQLHRLQLWEITCMTRHKKKYSSYLISETMAIEALA